MESILQSINEVVGVKGSFVCDEEGELVAHVLPSAVDETRLLPAARTLFQTLEGVQKARRRKVTEFDLVYRQGRMVVKNLRPGCLCILCVRSMNVPLLNLTANVAARKLSEMLKERERPPVTEAVTAPEEVTAAEEAVPAESSVLLLNTAREAIAAARERGAMLRLLGGMAVKERCPSAPSITLPPDALDLDFAAYGQQRPQIEDVMESLGYEAHRRFNAMHGRSRLRFSEPEEGLSIDVFVDALHMCHRLDFADRLPLHESTLPLADLLLSKLQIVQLDEKDLRDIYALLYDHELGHEADPETVDAGFIASICSDDWGWYKTVTMNIEKSIDLANEFLSEEQKDTYVSRARRLGEIIESAPKSLRWRARARIGEARRWYDLPEAPAASTTDRINRDFFARLNREFTGVMGPLGPVIIEDEIAALGETPESFPRDKLAELVERVSTRIEGEDKRARFQQIMLDILRGS